MIYTSVSQLRIRRIKSQYWKPNTDYCLKICSSVKHKIENGDIVLISSKAIATACGNMVNEERICPTLASRIIARIWMRYIWGYFLGYFCRLKSSTIQRLRDYPEIEGGKHKQLAIRNFGILQALRFGSEGGIDTSNLPHSYVSLPLINPSLHAKKIYETIKKETGKENIIILVDSDKTYSFHGLHLSPTKSSLPTLHSEGGFVLYMLGRFLKFKPRSTPLAIYPQNKLPIQEALDIANLSHRAMGAGSGRTAWDMAEKFNVALTCVTWEMISLVDHYPIVIARS